MIDSNIIRENYAQMDDGLLIKVAREDGLTLTPGAFQILKDEFKKRNLDYSHIDTVEENKLAIYQEQMEEIKANVQNNNLEAVWKYTIDEKINGTSNNEVVAGLIERGLEEPRAIQMLSDLPEKLKEIIKANDTKMLYGAIAFTGGILVSLLGFFRAIEEKRIYFGAWALIIFGFARFFTGRNEKKKYEQYLKIVGDNAVNNEDKKKYEYRGH